MLTTLLPARGADVPSVTLTPHLAGGTREALVVGAMNVLENPAATSPAQSC